MSTRDVAAAKRFEYWVEMLRSTYVHLESSTGKSSDFFAEIEKSSVGELEFSSVRSTAPLVRRTRRLVSQATNEYVLVHCAKAGKAMVEQRGRSVRINSGDITIYLSTEPYDLIFNEWSDTRVLRIPLAAIKPCVRNLEDLTAKIIPSTSVEAAMLRGMIASLWSGQGPLGSRSAMSVSAALIQATAACLQAVSGETNHQGSTLDAYYFGKAKAAILHNIRSTSLSTEEVAAAVGISSRHLCRIFEREALSVSRFIWAERLEGCKRDLIKISSSRERLIKS